MNGYFTYIIKWLSAFILILIPTAGGAVESSPLWDMFQNLSFNPPSSDLSVALLAKMFGAMPGIPQFTGASGTMVGVVFGVFNAGILALSGVFLSYTITKILTETTMDGSAMGKGTTIWTAVRCSLSTSLLVPQASGYSMINTIVMWIVIQGVGLADLTWVRVLDYLKTGGVTYAPPQAMVDYSLINYDVYTGDGRIDSTLQYTSVGSADVLRSLACSYVIHAALRNRQELNKAKFAKVRDLNNGRFPGFLEQMIYTGASNPLPEKSEKGFSIYKHLEYKCAESEVEPKCTKAYVDGVLVFPYIENEAKNHYTQDYGLIDITDSSDVLTFPHNLTGICGTISYTLPIDKNDNAWVYAERAARYTRVKRQGLLDMVAILEPTAKRLVNSIKLDGGKRQLDPDTYVIYKDSKEHLFLKENKDTKDKFVPRNQLVFDLMNNVNTIAINWPLGTDEMLSAALAYQVALENAQKAGSITIADEQQKKIEEAKKQGWINAGSYYKLLTSMKQDIQKEYNGYRLVGYTAPGAPFPNTNIENRDMSPGYWTLFKQANTASVNNPIGSTVRKTAIETLWTNNGDLKLLEKVLNWIYLTYPYAKLHGQQLTPALDQTATGSSHNAVLTSPLSLGIEEFMGGSAIPVAFMETVIWMLAGTGAMLLAMPTTVPVGAAMLMPIPMAFLILDINRIFIDWNANMGKASAAKDPIMRLQDIGNSMIINSLGFFTIQLPLFFSIIGLAMLVSQFALSLLSGVAATVSYVAPAIGVPFQILGTMHASIVDMFQTMVFLNVPVAIGILGPVLVSGIVFAIYIPLIPYLLFLFGAISWFISVLVLMAAAPIICFLMLWGNSSQENPLLAREAEQFVMQVIGIFFRPTLMIIGLVTGIVLSYIGVDLLNLGFSNVVEIIMAETSITQVRLKLIQQLGVVLVYTFTMVSVVNMCFSTIYLLYSEAMRVAGIAAPVVGMEEKYMEGVKGGVTQAAESATGGLKESSVSLKGMAHSKEFSLGKKQGGAKGDGKTEASEKAN